MGREMRDLNKIREDYEFRLSGREFKWLVTVSGMICILVFVLGFLIGRNVPLNSSSRVDESRDFTPERPSFAITPKQSPGRYTFFDELAGDKPSDGSSSREPKEVPAPDESGNLALAREGARQVIREVRPPKQPGEDDGSGKPAERERIAPSRYTVQVGAFTEKEVAENLSRKLRKKGYPSYTMDKTLPGRGVWHRVRVGNYESRKEAERVADMLERRERFTTFVTLYAQ